MEASSSKRARASLRARALRGGREGGGRGGGRGGRGRPRALAALGVGRAGAMSSMRAWSKQAVQGGGSGGGGKDGSKTERVRVARYFAGKRPDWAHEDGDGAAEGGAFPRQGAAGGEHAPPQAAPGGAAGGHVLQVDAAGAGVSDVPVAPRVLKKSGADAGAGAAGGRARRAGPIESDSDSDSDGEMDRRRARARARAAGSASAAAGAPAAVMGELPAAAAPVAAAAAGVHAVQPGRPGAESESESGAESGSDESGSSSGSEYETDSEDDEEGWFGGTRAMAKPVFVRRDQRATVREREAAEAAAAAAAGLEETRKKERQEETRRQVIEEIRREEAAAQRMAAEDAAEVDTDNEAADADEEFELWRQRELARLMEDFESMLKVERAREEVERVRDMDDETRRAYEKVMKEREGGGGGAEGVAKPKIGFLQKYYHKGAFFQSGADDSMQVCLPQRVLSGVCTRVCGMSARPGARWQPQCEHKPDYAQLADRSWPRRSLDRPKWTPKFSSATSQPPPAWIRWTDRCCPR